MEKYIKLNNNVKIPSLGFGTWQTPDGKTAIKTIKAAIESGYTHIDAAAIYGNEKGVGQGINESGIKRDALFVTSKVWNKERGYETTLKAFEKTLQDLQLDYLDLYLIHWPASAHQFKDWKKINSDTWRAMEKMYADGKIKAIGVSNFLEHHLSALLETAKVIPAVNQIEFHPGFMQKDCVLFCKEKNIQIEGWSPLGRGGLFDNALLKTIASKYKKSVAQICIRWAMQHNVIPLPKSTTPQRIKENIEVYDFEILADDMALINQMKNIATSGLHPDKIDF